MRKALLLAALLALAGCVYVPPVTQGNYLDAKDLSQLKVGMTTDQVTFLFGQPTLANPFYRDTWYYVYYVKAGAQSKAVIYRLTIQFQDGKVASFDTSAPISQSPS
ncbi:MAG TPA: outer membrane protein assembly factor BamE [Gammaproteobacteria bacterium]|nr:outer membrane protein assembly factor BamE [Gammaproteobacteria bacterium]